MLKTRTINLAGERSTKQGETRVIRVNIRDPNNAIDFTNAVLDARIARRSGSTRLLEFTPTYFTRTIGSMTAELKLSSTQTDLLKGGVLYWECFVDLNSSADPVWCFAEGDFEVRERIQ